MDDTRQRAIDWLVARGEDREFATYLIDEHPTSFAAADARRAIAVEDLGHAIRDAAKPAVDRIHRIMARFRIK